jgi:hypothetical protein
MCQYRYFAKVAEERMAPGDAALVVTHCPRWLVDWFWGANKAKNLRQLLRGPLRGRARVHLAGDLHFYMRHSFRPYARGGGGSGAASEASTPAGGSPVQGGSPVASRCPTPPPFAPPPSGQLHQSLVSRLGGLQAGARPSAAGRLQAAGASPRGGSPAAAAGTPSAGAPPRRASTAEDAAAAAHLSAALPAGMPVAAAGGGSAAAAAAAAAAEGLVPPVRPPPLPPLPPMSPPSLGSSPPSHHLLGSSPPAGAAWWPGLRVLTPRAGSPAAAAPAPADAAAAARGAPGPGLRRSAPSGLSLDGEWEGPPPGWRLNEPEHLVCCGGGGAFLHPTHVFSYARFRPVQDPAAGPIYVRPPPEAPPGAAGALRRAHPSSSSLYSLPRRDDPAPAGGEYRCAASFPSPADSLRLGRRNLSTFRHMNSRFDVIGGGLYYLLVVSVLPRCSGVAAVLDAASPAQAARLFAAAAAGTVGEIFATSRASLAALAFLFVLVFGFARGGGVGAIGGAPGSARVCSERHATRAPA